MKKLLVMLLVLAVAFALVACSREEPERPVLRMATSAGFPPFEMWEGDRIVGFDPCLAAAIGNILGYDIEIVDMDFGAIILSVQTGQVDFGMAGMTVRDDRRAYVDFSQGYFYSGQRVLVATGGGITSTDDLARPGIHIGVQNATTGHIFADENFPDASVDAYPLFADAVMALIAGAVDAVIIDVLPGYEFARVNEGRIELLDGILTAEYYGIAFQHGSPLTARFDDAINQLRANSTFQGIYDYWIYRLPGASRYVNP